MGSTANEKGEKEKLPLAPDLDQIFNRISMGINRHSLLASSLKTPSTTTSTTTSTTKKGFSSLAARSSSISTTNGFPSTKQLATSLNEQRRSEKTNASRLSDLDALFSEPYNAGIGYVPPKGAASSSTGGGSLTGDREKDRKLRAQILGGGGGRMGKRGREEGNDARNKKQSNLADESDSDDDIGRSALGRSKRVRIGVETATATALVGRKGEDKPQTQAKAHTTIEEAVDNNDNISKKGETTADSGGQPSVVVEEEAKTGSDISPEKTPMGPESEVREGGKAEGEGEEEGKQKKEKSKKSKNRNKKKKKTEEGAAVPKEGCEQGEDEED